MWALWSALRKDIPPPADPSGHTCGCAMLFPPQPLRPPPPTPHPHRSPIPHSPYISRPTCGSAVRALVARSPASWSTRGGGRGGGGAGREGRAGSWDVVPRE